MEHLVAALPGAAFLAASTVLIAGASARAKRRRRDRDEAAASRPPLQLRDWEVVTQEDVAFAGLAQQQLSTIARPIHSNFLVSAVISYLDASGALRHVCGVNSETCVLPSAICAERCALVQLRLKPSFARIVSVYITSTTEGGDLITPGVLCREMLQEYGPPGQTRVILFSPDWCYQFSEDAGNVDAHGRRRGACVRGKHQVWRLSDLYPHPPLYHRIPRSELLGIGKAFSDRMQPVRADALDVRGLQLMQATLSNTDLVGGSRDKGSDNIVDAILALHREVTALAGTTVAADQLYPINFAAGVLFSDGTTCVARQDKGLEYGCTVDAAVKLIPAVLTHSSATPTAAGPDRAPLVLLHCDQFGICHALHAVARAWFFEHGLGSVAIFIHDGTSAAGSGDVDARELVVSSGGGGSDGLLVRTTVERLSPAVPRISL